MSIGLPKQIKPPSGNPVVRAIYLKLTDLDVVDTVEALHLDFIIEKYEKSGDLSGFDKRTGATPWQSLAVEAGDIKLTEGDKHIGWASYHLTEEAAHTWLKTIKENPMGDDDNAKRLGMIQEAADRVHKQAKTFKTLPRQFRMNLARAMDHNRKSVLKHCDIKALPEPETDHGKRLDAAFAEINSVVNELAGSKASVQAFHISNMLLTIKGIVSGNYDG